ncbi:MAG: glycosyltransferase [Candidatus Symbiothrix sp.]|jgi:glycosyltransferase involved in cell wall biosynthesis|nr:glycosyltransferase [Candidatus Symbiothrix sp.]
MIKISIIIPLYNKENCIAETVQSVLQQSFHNFELIIVDDGSTDGSLDVVRQIQDDRIIVYTKTNGGVSAARNFGIQKAKCEYLVFLDADDIMLPNCLKTLLDLQQKYNTDIASANFYSQRNSNKLLYCSGKREGIVKHPIFATYWKLLFIRTGNTLYKRHCFDIIKYDETLNRYEDMKLILEHLKKYSVAYSPLPVMIYNRDSKGLSICSPNNIYKDFAFHLDFAGKNIWEKLIYGQILSENIHIELLKNKYGIYYYYKNLAIRLSKVKGMIKRKIKQYNQNVTVNRK